MWTTYRFYDEKGRRLAIFAEDFGQGKELKITIITCSQKDQFSKVRAKKLFEKCHIDPAACACHPTIIRIPVINDKPKWTFIHWCQDNYFKRIPVVAAYNTYGIGRVDPGANYYHVKDLLPEKKILGLVKSGHVSRKLSAVLNQETNGI